MPSATRWQKLNTWKPMRLRNCKRCGKPYETDRPDTYLCPACSVEAKLENGYGEDVGEIILRDATVCEIIS